MRKSNFELLRLFCIFGIVVMHAMGNIDTSLSVWNTESHIFVNALFNTEIGRASCRERVCLYV